MNVRFWGVRGDIAVPGRATIQYGGNTLCACVTDKLGDLCILDAGTGLIPLGQDLMGKEFGQGNGKALFLISHGDWDHTQGIGFFLPFFVAGNRFSFYGLGSDDLAFYDRLEAQLAAALSPLQTLNHLVARLAFRESETSSFDWGCIHIHSHLLPPQVKYAGGYRPLAYKLCQDQRSLVYIPQGEYPRTGIPADFVAFCQEADLLIHEAYFSADDYQPGWGHSSIEHAIQLAARARIPRLVLSHYGPAYDDPKLTHMIEISHDLIARMNLPVPAGFEILGAYEGLEFTV